MVLGIILIVKWRIELQKLFLAELGCRARSILTH